MGRRNTELRLCRRERRPCLVWRGGCNRKNCPRTARGLGREKPARVRSSEGGALPKSLTGVRVGQSREEGRVWSPRPSLVLARNPTLRASRKEPSQGLGPKATSARAAPGDAAGMQRKNKTRHGRPFPASALTPPHSLRHTTLFSPRSVTGGAIFPKPWSRSHRLPLTTYFGPESCARSGEGPSPPGGEAPPPPRAAPSSDVTRLNRARPACAETAAA